MANKTEVKKKNAKRALKDARKAVEKARKAVRKSSKKLRNQAEALRTETKKIAKKHDAALQSGGQSRSVPTVAVTKSKKPTSVITPPLPRPKTVPTLIELREQAKVRKIAGYSKLNKAELIAVLA